MNSFNPADDSDFSPNIVEITARGMQFLGPAQIPAGWNTFRLINESGMVHFAAIERAPQGHGIAEQQEQVAPVFQQGMDLLNAGDREGAMAKFGELPAWFGQIVFMGGPGLTGAGRSSESTVYLLPGTYLVECYVKTGGIFHSVNPGGDGYGMIMQIEVTGEPGPGKGPASTLDITISSGAGIQVEGTPTAGQHIVSVTFADQQVHENFVQHDVHLVRLADDTDMAGLEAWMDWRLPQGLQTPAPVEFIGGLNEMPAGHTGYIHVTLEPGRYAWIAEVPNAGEKGMLKS